MGSQRPQETSSSFPGPRPEWPVRRLCTEAGSLQQAGEEHRETCGHTDGRRPPPAAPSRSRDRPGGRAAGARGDARPSRTLGRPRSSRFSSAATRILLDPHNRTPQHPGPRPDPGRRRRGAHHPVTRALRSVTTNAAALFLRLLGDPPTSSATNETRSL